MNEKDQLEEMAIFTFPLFLGWFLEVEMSVQVGEILKWGGICPEPKGEGEKWIKTVGIDGFRLIIND